MALQKIGPINTTNVNKLTRSLKASPELRKNAGIRIRRNLYTYVESTFDLTPAQKKEMRGKMPKDAAAVLGHACATALEHNGEIEFEISHERRNPAKPNLRAEFYCRGGDDGLECGVRITWEK